jgi:uncharacterized membrane protein
MNAFAVAAGLVALVSLAVFVWRCWRYGRAVGDDNVAAGSVLVALAALLIAGMLIALPPRS